MTRQAASAAPRSVYRYLRPLLFALPPETAHALTLAALRCYGVGRSRPRTEPQVRVMGLDFPNRVGLAAGFDKDGIAVAGAARLGFGFIETGTVTPRPQPGNPKPRLFRLREDAALINRMGFNNAGTAALAANLHRQRRRLAIPLGVNIGKNRETPLDAATDDYAACLAAVYDVADYVVVNVSSPNTAGLRSLQAPAATKALVEALVRQRDDLAQRRPNAPRSPLLVKLAPDLTGEDQVATAMTAIAAGADGLVAVNTTLTRAPTLRSPRAAQAGGLSGQPLFPATLAAVQRLRAAIGPEPTLIAVGGVASAADAQALREAGADLVQVYSALVYQGPGLIRTLAATLC